MYYPLFRELACTFLDVHLAMKPRAEFPATVSVRRSTHRPDKGKMEIRLVYMPEKLNVILVVQKISLNSYCGGCGHKGYVKKHTEGVGPFSILMNGCIMHVTILSKLLSNALLEVGTASFRFLRKNSREG